MTLIVLGQRPLAPFYYLKHAKRFYCLFEINAFLEVDSVFKSTGLPECPRFWWGQNNSEGFLMLQVVENLVETSPHSPIRSSGPESTLKCLAHGRGVVTSSQASSFKRVSLVLRFLGFKSQ